MNLTQPSATNFTTVSTMSTPSGCTTNSASSISSNTTPSNQSVSTVGGPVATPGNKLNVQQQMTNGLFIRKEIQRFESVHPNIYSVYDLIDNITDFNLQQQIREHIVNIEDSFVNSQEWTLSRNVADLKLGILGSINSGKSSLVHRFLTGTYMQEESPEGGRFKKEVVIDGQSYLLLIRDEGGPPEMQFTHWVDVVIFVFSLENEESFNTIHQYCLKMNHYRNMSDVPFILVGTQDYISESNPRVIEDSRARNLANELKKCSYYETCATYGLHVERVFHDACQKVVNHRTQMILAMANISSGQMNRPTTPLQANSNIITNNSNNVQHQTNSIRLLAGSHLSSNNGQQVAVAASAVNTLNGHPSSSSTSSASSASSNGTINNNLAFFQANPHLLNSAALHSTLFSQPATNLTSSANMVVFKEPMNIQSNEKRTNRLFFEPANQKEIFIQPEHVKLDSLTPCSTPNQKRKDTNRRRSNLFTPNKKEDKKNNLNDMGIGRSIPIKQGFLYKKTNSTINKDWKKKFVTLNDDGSLRYYPSMNDYMDESHGKEIDLQKTTIKIPGSNKPRIGKSLIQVDTNRINNDINMLSLNGNSNLNGMDKNLYDDATHSLPHHQPASTTDASNSLARTDVNSKKRHRRVKSNHKSDQNKEDDQEGFEFIIVSLDNKQWHFEASSNEEREEWVQAIEQQILSSLQTNETNKLKAKNGGLAADNITILTMKNVPGNLNCADCDAPNPVWASLNLGTLICIECSGIHRNLGTHLSRVRSLELDDWSNELVQLMTSIGNRMLNSIYEANTKAFGKNKPTPNNPREEKEKWIRAKYETKQFLASLQHKDITVGKQLLDAVSRQDISSVILCLSHSKHEDVNSCVSQLDKRTSLHIAASQSNIVILQLLIWYGANVECQDNHGRNALSYARNAKSSECIQLLIHNGSSDTISTTNQQSNFISNPNVNYTANGTGSTNTLTKKTTSTSYLGFINNALSNCNNGTNGNNNQAGHYDKIPFNVV